MQEKKKRNKLPTLEIKPIFSKKHLEEMKKEIEILEKNNVKEYKEYTRQKKNTEKSLSRLIKAQNKAINSEWLFYSLSYLESSKKLLVDVKKEFSKSNFCLITVFYQIRHACELYIKFLRYLAVESLDESKRIDNIPVHDIDKGLKDLFPKLEKCLNNKAGAYIKRMRKINRVYPGTINNVSINTFLYLVGWLDTFARRYSDIQDKDNVEFRYPIDSGERNYFRGMEFARRFTLKDIEKVLNEVSSAQLDFTTLVRIMDTKDEYIPLIENR